MSARASSRIANHVEPRVEEPAVASCDEDEANVQDFLLASLRLAKAGLRRRSIDQFEDLLEFCVQIPRQQWPPEVTCFVDRLILPRHRKRFERFSEILNIPRKHRAPEIARYADWRIRRLVDWFKRPPHRTRSARANASRFWGDPNHVAAHFAALYIADRRPKGRGPYKIARDDGTKHTVTDAAVRRAIDEVNRSLRLTRSTHRADFKMVKELVRRSRTKRPSDRLSW
jgi:hypothetical protein